MTSTDIESVNNLFFYRTYIKQIAHLLLTSNSLCTVSLEAVRETVLTVEGKSRSKPVMNSNH
jgi:hypothetical protein